MSAAGRARGYFVPVPVVPVLLLGLEPVPVVVSVVLEDEPDVAPGAGVVGAGVVTEPEPETDPLAPGVVVVVDGDADGVRSGTGVSVVRFVRDSVHAVMVRPSARAHKPVMNLFMVVSSLGGVRVRSGLVICNGHARHALDRL